MARFWENNLVHGALMPDADRMAGTQTTDVYNMEDYGEITFIYAEGAGGTGTTVISVQECTSAAAAGATAIAFTYRLLTGCTASDTWGAATACASTGYTTVAGANKMLLISVRAEDLSDGYNFVRLSCVESADSAVDAGIMVILSEPRYSSDVMPTAIA